jgi:hypothetical protein
MQNPGLEHLPLEAQDRIIALRSRVVELESQIKNLIEIDLVAFDKCRDELADHKDQIINLVEVQRRYRKALVFYACRAARHFTLLRNMSKALGPPKSSRTS